MRFIDLHIDGFGKFHDFSLSFDPGMNIIYGTNEAGKSTLHTFLQAMLYGFTRARGVEAEHDAMARLTPWDNPDVYSGSLRFEAEDRIWRIERDFRKAKDDFLLVNETDGITLENPAEKLSALMGHLSETAYTGTVSIGQLKSTSAAGMSDELNRYITGMNTTGSSDLDVTGALELLNEKKEDLSRQLIPEASADYTALLTKIGTLAEELSDPRYKNEMADCIARSEHTRQTLADHRRIRGELQNRHEQADAELSENHFTDLASVQKCQKGFRENYKNYLSCRDTAASFSARILPWIFFLLAAACAAFAYTRFSTAILLLEGAPEFMGVPLAAVVPGFLSALFIVLGVAFTTHRQKNASSAKQFAKLLSDTLETHVGSRELTTENMDAFEQRMDTLCDLCVINEELQTSIAAQDETIRALTEDQTEARDALSAQQNTQWELDRRLSELNDMKDRATSLKAVIRNNQRIREDIDAVDLAMETLQELTGSIRTSFGLALNRRASERISGITGGLYTSMDVDEELNVWLNNGSRMVPLEQVSSGTADQIWLALRLSAADVVTGDTEMPLIFDDSFVLYDHGRLSSALTWLADTVKTQVIIFTCHHTESSILEEAGKEFRLTEL
ncbi:MAG: AAA family ATPase [Clostridium sp.]|nr:AAA family ATPase [Clostridium sp.]